MTRNILLIGKRQQVLQQLQHSLMEDGFKVTITMKVETAALDFNAADYDMILSCSDVKPGLRRHFENTFRLQNPNVLLVEGLAPVHSVLLEQCRAALNLDPECKVFSEFHIEGENDLKFRFTLKKGSRISITLLNLDFFNRVKHNTLLSMEMQAGEHEFIVPKKNLSRWSQHFLSIKVNEKDTCVINLSNSEIKMHTVSVKHPLTQLRQQLSLAF